MSHEVRQEIGQARELVLPSPSIYLKAIGTTTVGLAFRNEGVPTCSTIMSEG